MPKYLVIVESPTKARTVNAFLGPDYIVEATRGYVKDLPTDSLGIDLDNGFEPDFTTLRTKVQCLALLKQLGARAEKIFIATDPDIEGESIAAHLQEELLHLQKPITRVRIFEYTKAHISKAFASTEGIDQKLVRAQHARRVIDRLFNYELSKFVRSKLPSVGLQSSIGRVQASILQLVSDHELREANTLATSHSFLEGTFRSSLPRFQLHARLITPGTSNDEGKPAQRLDEDLLIFLGSKNYTISDIQIKSRKAPPPQPLTTVRLLALASGEHGIPIEQAMLGLRTLHEGLDLGNRGKRGVISYPRTNSVRINTEAIQIAEEYIYNTYGSDYLPQQEQGTKHSLSARKTTQPITPPHLDAHEGLHPLDLNITSAQVRKYAGETEARLYELIRSYFIASRMKAASVQRFTVRIVSGHYMFESVFDEDVFHGWKQVLYPDGTQRLPTEGISIGMKVTVGDLKIGRTSQSDFRITESGLLELIMELGIGKPGTLSGIITSLYTNGFLTQDGDTIRTTPLGQQLATLLRQQLPSIFNQSYLKRLEKSIESIATGDSEYSVVVRNFHRTLLKSLPRISETSLRKKARPTRASTRQSTRWKQQTYSSTEVRCPLCGATMFEREGAYGKFFGCSRFPACKGTLQKQSGS